MFPGLKTIPAFNGSGSAGGGGGGGGSGLTIALTATATSSTPFITIPGSAIAGDVAILIDLATDPTGSSIAAATPSGWSNVANSYVQSGGDVVRLMTSYRVLTAGEPGTSVTGMNSDRERKVMLVLRPSTSIVTVTPSTWNSEATTGNPATQTVAASGITAPLIVIAAAGVSSSTPAFTTETPSMTNITASATNIGLRIGYTIYNSSPSDQSIDIGDSDVNALQSGYVRFT